MLPVLSQVRSLKSNARKKPFMLLASCLMLLSYITWWKKLAGTKRLFAQIVTICFVIFLGLLVFTDLFTAKGAEAAWFNENWAYRKAINITAHTSAETNVYLNLASANALDTSDTTRFQSDCGDLRFTDVNGKLLPYYIVSGCGTATTVVHVFLQNFPAGAQTLYYYYGNPRATDGFSRSDFSTAATGVTIGSFGSEENSPAPVAYWSFDDATGTVAKDTSSTGANGTLSGSTTPVWTSGQCINQSCLSFNGTTSYVSVSSTVNNVRGIAFWVNPAASATAELLALNSTTDVRSTNGNLTAPGESSYVVYVNGNINGTLTANTWNYVTVLFPTTSASAITLGKGPLGVFKGYMDEVKFYNFNLSTAQIQANYNARGSLQGSGNVLGAKDQSYLSKGLVGYWKMDETAANTCSGGVNDSCDSSGNGNDADWNGNATASTSAKFGSGTTYDGTTGTYTHIGGSYFSTILDTADFSIAFWAKCRATGGAYISKKNNNNAAQAGWAVWCGTSTNPSKVDFRVADGTNQTTIASTTTVVDSSWHHIVGTVNRTSKIASVYVDGRLEATGDISAVGTLNNALSIQFGRTNDGNSLYSGVLDDMRIYNRVISAQEVEQLYNYAPGPVGSWNFEEGQGSVVNDTSGNGNTGSWSGTSSRFVQGKYGKGGSFNGSDAFVDVPDSTSDSPQGAITVEAWIKAPLSSQIVQAGIVSKDISGIITNPAYDLEVPSSGTVRFFMTDSNNTAYTLNASGLGDNVWYHVAGTYDGQNMRIYVNGVQKNSLAVAGLIADTTGTLKIGQQKSVSSRWFNGTIDEVKIYNYARSQKQVVEDMNASHPAGGSPVGSMIGWWKFNEGYGTTANNSGSYGPNLVGTLNTMDSPPTGSSGWTNDGKVSRALSFDGNSDYVNIPDDPAIDQTAGISVSTWINGPLSSEIAQAGVISKDISGSITNPPYSIEVPSSGTVVFRITNSANSSVTATATGLANNTWYHILGTYDGSYVRIYVNGVLKDTQPLTGSIAVTTGSLKIGQQTSGSGRWFSGKIDEVKLYNYPLLLSEVRIDYNGGNGLSFGVLGTASDGITASNSAQRSFCPPGDTTASCAPVSYWNFEEGNGSNLYDRVSGLNGQWRSGASLVGGTYASGIIGKAGSFNPTAGTNIQMPATASLNNTSAFSLEAWANLDPAADTNTTSYRVAGTLYSGGNVGYELMRDATTNKWDFIWGTGSTTQNLLSLNTVQRGTWYHLVGSYDGSTMRFYVNGQLQSSNTSPTFSTNSSQFFCVSGVGIDCGTSKFYGLIDEVKYYNYARSASQIAWDYNKGKPVAYYKFDECQGSILHDSTNNRYDQTLTIGGSGTTAVGTCKMSSSAWGGASGTATGKYNYAITLDGTDDYASTSATTIVTGSQNTYSAVSWGGWFDPQPFVISKTLMEKNREFRLTTDGSSKPNCSIWTAGGWSTAAVANTSIVMATWTHVFCVYDGSAISIYMNGQKVGSTSQSNPITSLNYTVLTTGHDFGGSTYYKGQVDEEEIFSYPLTQAQIQTLYNQSSAVTFGPATGTP